MNEHIPSAHEPSPNEMATRVVEMENELKTLRVEQERLTNAVKEFPGSGFDEELDEVSVKIAEIEGEISAYHDAKEGQQSMDI